MMQHQCVQNSLNKSNQTLMNEKYKLPSVQRGLKLSNLKTFGSFWEKGWKGELYLLTLKSLQKQVLLINVFSIKTSRQTLDGLIDRKH